MFALVVTGPLLASYAAALFGVPAAVFGALLRVFVLARLVVVAIGPGAEVLEASGQHVRRFAIVARIALPAFLATVVLAVVGWLYLVACLVAVACVAVELFQSLAAYRRVGVDCTVLPLLRDVPMSR